MLLATVALFAPLRLATHASTHVYDLNADWSDTQNPNGPWVYKIGDSLLGSAYNVTHWSDPFLGWGFISWGGGAGLFRNTVLHTWYAYLEPGDVCVWTAWEATTGCETDLFSPCEWAYWSNPFWFPEPSEPQPRPNIVWKAPAGGSISISGAVWPDWCSTFWNLSMNGVPISEGASACDFIYTRSSPFHFFLGVGGASALQNILVNEGDELKLEVGTVPGWMPIVVNFTVAFTDSSNDPVAAIQQLAEMVVTMNLQNGIENSLDSKLEAALEALDDLNENNNAAACNSLQAFINAVEAQRGTKLTDSQADQLITAAQEIQAVLNCGN